MKKYRKLFLTAVLAVMSLSAAAAAADTVVTVEVDREATVYAYNRRFVITVGGQNVEVEAQQVQKTVETENGIAEFTFTEDEWGYYDILIHRPGCLQHMIQLVKVDDERVALGPVSLYAGEVVEDGRINMQDLRVFLQNFNKTGEDIAEPLADVNGDRKVNMQDLRVFLQNFNKTGVKDSMELETIIHPVGMFVEFGEETAKGTETVFYLWGEKELFLVKDVSAITRPGQFFALTMDGGYAAPTLIGKESPCVAYGTVEFLDGEYFEVDGKAYEMAKGCAVYQINNAGDRVSSGELRLDKNVVVILNSDGEAAEIYQYKSEILAW